MSETKRFYWLKLQEDFFEDDTIDFIESQENGEKYCLFYLKLCLKALKSEGKLIRYVGNMLIPYDEKGLAKLTRTDVDTVRCALALFNEIGLVSRLDTGEIFINQLNEMVGTETDKAKLMRQKRAKEKLISNNVTPMLPKCYTEKELEKEKEIDKELDKDNTVKAEVTPLILNDNTEWLPTVKEYEEYKTLYPNVDIETQFRKMRGWLNGNPAKRKTRKGIARFVNNWLSNEQDKPKSTTSQTSSYVNNRRPASDSETNVDF